MKPNHWWRILVGTLVALALVGSGTLLSGHHNGNPDVFHGCQRANGNLRLLRPGQVCGAGEIARSFPTAAAFVTLQNRVTATETKNAEQDEAIAASQQRDLEHDNEIGALREQNIEQDAAIGVLTDQVADLQTQLTAIESGLREFSVRVDRTSPFTTDNTEGEVISFDREFWDTAEMFNETGTEAERTRLVAPVTGNYYITAHLRWDPNSVGARLLRICRGDNLAACNIATVAYDPVSTQGFGTLQSVSTTYRLNQGEFIQVVVGQHSGGPLNTGFGQGEDHMTVAMVRIPGR